MADKAAVADLIQWAAAFFVAVIVGLVTRLGWTKEKHTQPESQVEVIASAVDNRAIKALVESIDHAVDRMTQLHEETERRERRQIEAMDTIAKDIRSLIRCLEDFARAREY